MTRSDFAPRYRKSWALVIGINDYQHFAPLECAKSDARAVAELLTTRYGFPPENVTRLLDVDATYSAIRKACWQYADEQTVHPDDRLLVYFAGHGWRRGNQDPVGFLVPVDGTCDNLATLIPWEDITRAAAKAIPARHVFFILDACYGGLAATRAVRATSRHFEWDTHRRYARQLLTSGKSDEEVTDGEGVRPDHSIFTSYLLEALEGAGATEEGIVTARLVMQYVYSNMLDTRDARQTPHDEWLAGDGDFVFGRPQEAGGGLPEAMPQPDRTHEARLRQGVQVWNAWRNENPFVEPHLAGARLRDRDLSGANLKEANLVLADLSLSSLDRADLRRAKLSGANLSETTLRSARLDGADLTRANFDSAVFEETNLVGAKLSGARNLETTVVHHRNYLDDAALAASPGLPIRFLQALGLNEKDVALYKRRHDLQ